MPRESKVRSFNFEPETKFASQHPVSARSSSQEKLLGQKGCVLWFTGLSGSGKSTVACTLEHALRERGACSFPVGISLCPVG